MFENFCNWFFFSSSVFFLLNKRFKMDPIGIHDFGPAKNKMSNLLLRASRHVTLRLVRFFRFIRHTSVRRRESVVETPPRLVEFSAAKCQTSLKLPSSNDAGSVVLLDRKNKKVFDLIYSKTCVETTNLVRLKF
jgi:hypothetical protein